MAPSTNTHRYLTMASRLRRDDIEFVVAVVRGRSLGMIRITHDLAALSELADRILVMYAGAMETGTTAEIIGSLRHPSTRKLLESVPSRNVPGEKLRQIRGTTPSLLSLGAGCPFNAMGGGAAMKERRLPTIHPTHRLGI